MANDCLIRKKINEIVIKLQTHKISSIIKKLVYNKAMDKRELIMDEAYQVCKRVYEQWQNLYFEKLVEYGYDKETARKKSQVLFALIHGTVISSFIKQSNVDLLLIREEIKNILN